MHIPLAIRGYASSYVTWLRDWILYCNQSTRLVYTFSSLIPRHSVFDHWKGKAWYEGGGLVHFITRIVNVNLDKQRICFVNVQNSSAWTDTAREGLYLTLSVGGSFPSSVYLGRRWCHSHYKMVAVKSDDTWSAVGFSSLVDIALFLGLHNVQFLTACSMQSRRGRPGPFYHINDVVST